MSIIVMAEDAWMNSPLSIARHYGQIKFGGYIYLIVDKRGKDLWECSAEARKEGRSKAIMPGEPADLCREDFIPIYKKLGREKFLEFLKRNPGINSVKEARKLLKEQNGAK